MKFVIAISYAISTLEEGEILSRTTGRRHLQSEGSDMASEINQQNQTLTLKLQQCKI